MPVIKVEMLAGRSTDEKRRLVKAFTDSFIEICGGKPQSVNVILTDVAREDWGFGGELVSDMKPAASTEENQ